MTKLSIVMDFDGVFTDPTLEGDRCRSYFREALLDRRVTNAVKLDALLGLAREMLRMAPPSFGWRSQGALAAFALEDPLIESIGVADVLDQMVSFSAGEPAGGAEFLGSVPSELLGLAQELKKADPQGQRLFTAVSNDAFHRMSTELMESGGPHADPGSIRAVDRWLAAGHAVTVITNARSEEAETLLKREGLQSKNLSVRGQAMKFEIGPNADQFIQEWGGLKFNGPRPKYAQALKEVGPDMVIGDGFSLDLFTPCFLGERGEIPWSVGARLKLRPYTPSFTHKLLTSTQRPRSLSSFDDWDSLL